MGEPVKKVKIGNFPPLYFVKNRIVRISEEEGMAYMYEASNTYFIDKLYDTFKEFEDLFEEKTTFSEVEDLKLNNYFQKKASLEEVVVFPYTIPLVIRIDLFNNENFRHTPAETVTIRKDLSIEFFTVSIRGFTTLLSCEQFIKNFNILLQKIVFAAFTGSGGSLYIEEEILPSLASAFERYPFLYDKLPHALAQALCVNFKNNNLNVSRKEVSFLRKCIEKILATMAEKDQEMVLKFIELRFSDIPEEKIFDFLNSLLCGLEDLFLLTKCIVIYSNKNIEISKDFLINYILNLSPEKRIEKIKIFLKKEKNFYFTYSSGLEETTFLKNYLEIEKDVKLKADTLITYLKTLIDRKYSQGDIIRRFAFILPEKVSDKELNTELLNRLKDENLTSEEKEYLQGFLYTIASSCKDRQMISILHPEILKSKKKLQIAIKFAEKNDNYKIFIPEDAIKNMPAKVIELLLESIVNKKSVEIENKEEFFKMANVIALTGGEKFDLVRKAKTIVHGDCPGVDFVRTVLTLSEIPLKQKAIRIKSGLPTIIYNCYLILKEIEKEGKDVREYAKFIGSLFAKSTGIHDDYFSERAIKQLEKEINNDKKKLQMAIDTVRYIRQIFTEE